MSVHPAPPATGVPAVFQGRYGARGNLELFAPAPDGGITCCWFNSDPPEGPVAEPAIPAATWSAGLVFGADCAYDAAAGIQTVAGPDFLEIVASGPDGLHHWTWSPADAFTRTATFEVGRGLPFVAETPHGLVIGQASGPVLQRWVGGRPDHVTLDVAPVAVHADSEGAVHALVPRTDSLALVTWARAGTLTETPTPLPLGGPAALTDGAAVVAIDDELVVWQASTLTHHPLPDLRVDAVALGPSTMGTERTFEVVTRSGSRLRHHRLGRP